MFQVCLFGSYEGRLQAGKRVFLTLFGGCTLRRPTLVRQLLTERARGQNPGPHQNRRGHAGHWHTAITLFGATEIKVPTLAEEFIDLQEAVRTGALNVDAWDHFTAGLADLEGGSVFSVTLFGSFEEAQLPSEDEEIDSLALQRHLGNISDNVVQVLQLGVGQDDSHRRSVLRQAVAASA